MKQEICIRKLNGLITPIITKKASINALYVNLLNLELLKFGYIINENLAYTLACVDYEDLQIFATTLLKDIKIMKGADVNYSPMYSNFPQQVKEMDNLELYINAIVHYWSYGTWTPEQETLLRPIQLELTSIQSLELITNKDYLNVFTKIVTSNDSLSDYDKSILRWFLYGEFDNIIIPNEIPYKETLCITAVAIMDRNIDASKYIKTTTDVLRIITYLSDGDISLATNTKFKSLKRPVRRKICAVLNNVANLEDFKRHKNKWIKALHSLHVGDYSKTLFKMARILRENEPIETYNSKVEKAIKDEDENKVLKLLIQKPGEFARRLDYLLRTFNSQNVLTSFKSIVDSISTRVLTQIYGHIKRRRKAVCERTVFPKGSIQKAIIIKKDLIPLNSTTVFNCMDIVETALINKFKSLPPLGTVYIDNELNYCPLPTGQRSASSALKTVARGTQLPIPDGNTLRLFIYWKGDYVDVDLSATFHTEDFKTESHVSYTNLRDKQIDAYHSGDIVRAPKGASEFIDIDMNKAIKRGYRYVAMTLILYAGSETFNSIETCYAGWMSREYPNSNELFDPKTVKQKIDVTSETSSTMVCLFDIIEKKMIWVDTMIGRNRTSSCGDNVHSKKASIQDLLRGIVQMDNKMSLKQLFKMHTDARGELVENKGDAETIFSIDEGIGPYNINEINSEFII